MHPSSLPHKLGDFAMAAATAGYRLDGVDEYAPDREFATRFPGAEKYIGWPMLVVLRLGIVNFDGGPIAPVISSQFGEAT